MIKVDMDREVVLCPVNGQPVPFAIHTIKNVVLPEPDNHAHYLRINFFAPGQALGKEASRRMARLIDRCAMQCTSISCNME
jgi:nucleosome binding factor SPN SPT16 subunit